jgi:hypothetical protein
MRIVYSAAVFFFGGGGGGGLRKNSFKASINLKQFFKRKIDHLLK